MGRKHYILMGGIKGCMPAHCDAYESIESAVGSANCIYNYDLQDDLLDELKEYGYIDFESFEVKDYNRDDELVKASHFYGNEYVSIDECNCAEPWVHSEYDDPDDWEDYPRFIVNEYSTGYEIEDVSTGKTHWLSDGIGVFICDCDDPDCDCIPQVGTEAFRQYWQDALNESSDETREAYFS